MKLKEPMFRIVIRSPDGTALAAGQGRRFEAALHRLYRDYQLGPGRKVVRHDYHATWPGFPYGEHHVQLAQADGRLDPEVVVQVTRW